MIVYNVTSKVDHSIAVLWLNWMKQEHIPEIIATGCFTHATILHMIETDETDGITYAIQYHAESKILYNRFIEEYASSFSNKATGKWGNKYIAFRSVLQIVN